MDDVRHPPPRVFVTRWDLDDCIARLEARERFTFDAKVTRPEIGPGGRVDRHGFDVHLWGIGPIYGRTLVGRFLRLPNGTAIAASTRIDFGTVAITAFPVTGLFLMLGMGVAAGGDAGRGFFERLPVFAVLAAIGVAATIGLVAVGSWRISARDRVAWAVAELFGATEAGDPAAVLAVGVVDDVQSLGDLPRAERIRRALLTFGMGLFAYGIYVAAALSGDALAEGWGRVGQYTPAIWFVGLGTFLMLSGIVQLLPKAHPWRGRLEKLDVAFVVVAIISWFAAFLG